MGIAEGSRKSRVTSRIVLMASIHCWVLLAVETETPAVAGAWGLE